MVYNYKNYTYVIIELNMELTTTIYNQPSSQIWGHQGLFDWEYRTFQNDYICGALTRKWEEKIRI